jgi:hypothetical protein
MVQMVISFLCEMMSNDTIIPRTVRNNKRNGTQSVYLESTQPKNQKNATVEDETEEEEKKRY